jgi:riboflavin synthase
MFTGIITDIGTISSVTRTGDTRITVSCNYSMDSVAIGASIACSGVCLTVVDKGTDENGAGWFSVDASAETLRRTAAHMWVTGSKLNLERALKVGDELGGHIVTGHVDGIGEVVRINPEGDSHKVDIKVDAALAPYIAAKGSVTVDGVSLTVNAVRDQADGSAHFSLNIIPHTWDVTTLGDLQPGCTVNIEIDVLARYLSRMNERKIAS